MKESEQGSGSNFNQQGTCYNNSDDSYRPSQQTHIYTGPERRKPLQSEACSVHHAALVQAIEDTEKSNTRLVYFCIFFLLTTCLQLAFSYNIYKQAKFHMAVTITSLDNSVLRMRSYNNHNKETILTSQKDIITNMTNTIASLETHLQTQLETKLKNISVGNAEIRRKNHDIQIAIITKTVQTMHDKIEQLEMKN